MFPYYYYYYFDRVLHTFLLQHRVERLADMAHIVPDADVLVVAAGAASVKIGFVRV